MKRDMIETLVIIVLSVLTGNCVGDSATVHDCARYGEARMASGGAVVCAVKKENTND